MQSQAIVFFLFEGCWPRSSVLKAKSRISVLHSSLCSLQSSCSATWTVTAAYSYSDQDSQAVIKVSTQSSITSAHLRAQYVTADVIPASFQMVAHLSVLRVKPATLCSLVHPQLEALKPSCSIPQAEIKQFE